MRFARKCERLLLACGLLAVYASALIHGTLLPHVEVEKFMQLQQSAGAATKATAQSGSGAPDFKLWSKARIAGYEQSLSARVDPPLAILRIPRIDLTVPLLEGTDELTLNRAVGHIAGTVRPGENGNTGIAGHRDGFFRGLKDVQMGDEVTLLLSGRTETYTVDRIVIVEPSDVAVLRSGSGPALTLVTCYPFYFVGSAPRRYIVHAALANVSNTSSARRTTGPSLDGNGLK